MLNKDKNPQTLFVFSMMSDKSQFGLLVDVAVFYQRGKPVHLLFIFIGEEGEDFLLLGK